MMDSILPPPVGRPIRASSFHAWLREATRKDHDRVDGAFAAFDLASRSGYGAFLGAHARALVPVEAWLAEARFPLAGRSAALQGDLTALGVAPGPLARLGWTHGEAAHWGAAYVIEGSRLGGQVLARRVAPAFPRAYLAAAHAPGAWRAFLGAMDAAAAAGGADWHSAALVAARRTFGLFAAAAEAMTPGRAAA